MRCRRRRLGHGRVRHHDVAGCSHDIMRDLGRGVECGDDVAEPPSHVTTSPRSLLRHGDIAKPPRDVAQVAGGPSGNSWRHCDVAEPLCEVAVLHVRVALVRHCDVARHCDGIPCDFLMSCRCDIATSRSRPAAFSRRRVAPPTLVWHLGDVAMPPCGVAMSPGLPGQPACDIATSRDLAPASPVTLPCR